jgi:hypothetical protein
VLFIAPPGGLFFGETSRYYRKMEIGAGGIPSDVPGSNRSNLLLFCTTQVIGGTGSFNQIKKIDRR